MSENMSIPCNNLKRFMRLRRILWPIDSWLDIHVWYRLAEATRKRTEPDGFNRFLAGISEFAWIKYCGYGWKFAAHCGLIYWGWVKVTYDEALLPADIGEHLGKPGEIVWPEEKAE